jgi:transposase
VLGYVDETWWSRLQQPSLHSWVEGPPLRLQQLPASQPDPDPKALCCYGLLRADTDRVLLRFVDGRPVSHLTTEFLGWALKRLAREGKKAWLLVWDNASWHISREVRHWIRAHNRRVKQSGGVRLLACRLPVKSPWLNPIEPRWVHGKRAVVEPDRKLTAAELRDRVCHYFGCQPGARLKQKVA